ncbi:unnamed protein product [Peronospora destructor]|uniref:RxLR effector protein n=1 Tax=Peronospora destructor TaxID=86335 RepID=A0AAV0TBH3_9STRA|nr:unnamed protein product [Peronospora destructor]
MMLSVKKTFGLMLCASTFAAAETTRASALRTHPRRVLASGIHHSVKYTPNVVKQTKEPENLLFPRKVQEMVLDTVDEDVDLYTDNSIDADVNLKNDEVMDIEADSDQEVDISTNSNLDASVTGSLDATHQLDSDIDFMKGEVEVELEDGEAYEQNLDMGSDEVLDEFLDIPEGAKSIHLRMHKGNVDLDIIKNDIKKDAPHKEEKPKEEKKEEKAPATETKEATVSYAAEAKSWIQNNVTKAPILGSFIGAAVGVVGLAVVAIAKSRKRASEKSAEDMSVNADGEEDAVEEDAVEEDAVEEDAVEEKKASIVEGSV